MRLLVHSVGSAGHVLPLVVWARAARDEGHDVHFAVEQQLASIVAGHGFEVTALPTTEYMTNPDVRAELVAKRRAMSEQARARSVLGSFVERSIVGLETLFDAADVFQPDLVLRDQAAHGGWALAEARGVPWVCFSFLPRRPEFVLGLIGDLLEVLRVEAGLAAIDPRVALDPGLHLVAGPHGWYSDDEIGPSGLLAQPPVDLGATDADVPPSLERLGRPAVYISFGTVAGPETEALAMVFEGLRDLDVGVVTTTQVPAGVATEKLIVEEWIPQLPLMERVDAVVGHAGYGTVMTSLTAGVPLLSIPGPMIDNQSNATRLVNTGAGRVLQPADITPERVVEEVEALLESADHLDAARRVREDIQTLPSAREVVRALEHLADTGRHSNGGVSLC